MASQPGSTTIRCVNLDNILLTGSNVKITRLQCYGVFFDEIVDNMGMKKLISLLGCYNSLELSSL